jgi:hypothetical protein
MSNFLVKNKLVFVLFLGYILNPLFVSADTIISTSTIVVSATVTASTPPGGGGGGGGGGGTPVNLETIVNFSGMAYPLSKVYILKDGKISAVTIADPAANFSVSLSGLTTDTYSFSVYGEDSKGRKSAVFSFPIFVTAGTTVNIGNIFLSPTIDTDKSEVKRGDNIIIFGQSAPTSEITISVHSNPEYFFKVKSNKMGAYLYNLDSSILELGQHLTKSKAALVAELSSFNVPVSFLVGNLNKLKDGKSCGSLRGDLNCDMKVNLVDFSIMAYWYKRPNPPSNVDLNNDGNISLSDFSIMVFNWTG